jgi:hypothetical protein
VSFVQLGGLGGPGQVRAQPLGSVVPLARTALAGGLVVAGTDPRGARCFAVGNALMSPPCSAMITS